MQRVGRCAASLVGVVGLLVLVGWYTGGGGLTSMGSVSMKPNAALSFVALAVAVVCFDRRRVAVSLGALVAGLGLVTLVEYARGVSTGVDRLLPGIDVGSDGARMAPTTAIALLLLGTAVVSGALGRPRLMRGVAMVAFGIGQVAILGYVYGVSSLYSVGGFTRIALHTSVCVVVLSLSILLLDPSSGLVGLVRSRGSAARLLRPLVPFLLVGPPVLGWLCLQAEERAWFDNWFGVVMLIMGMTVLGGALSWRAAVQLDQLDRQRDAAWAAMDRTNRSLEVAVTDRTRELADRQSFTDGLLETIGVGIVSCDATGQHLVRNRAHREMVGLKEGQPLLDFLNESGDELTQQQYPLIRALRGEDVGAVDLLIGPPGGPHREIVAIGSQIADRDGAVLGAVAILTDVTVERTASRALDEEHRQLVEAQRIGKLGSFEHDFATGTWTFSDQLCTLWGVEPGALDAQMAVDLTLPEDQELSRAAWDAAARSGGHHTYVYRIRRGDDGAERIIRSSVEVDLGADGRALHGHGTHLDITDLTLAERAAQRSNAFFEAVLTASPDYTFVTDLASGGILYGSSGKEILGITSEQLESLEPEEAIALIHPDDQVRLRAINTASRDLEDGQVLTLRYQAMHADGDWRWLNRRITPFRRDETGGVVEVLGVVRDITDVMNAQERLSHAALHDSLTGLPNRALLVDRLDAALARSGRDHREVAVLFCDLDGFKRVNDTAGHAAGDAVLVEVAHRITTVLRDNDTVARVGGDEFVIVIEPWDRQHAPGHEAVPATGHETDRALAERIAQRVADVVRLPVRVKDVEHTVTASIGVTYAQLAPTGLAGSISAEQVLQDADTAMYVAKGRGKDRVEVFEHGVGTDLAGRTRLRGPYASLQE